MKEPFAKSSSTAAAIAIPFPTTFTAWFCWAGWLSGWQCVTACWLDIWMARWLAGWLPEYSWYLCSFCLAVSFSFFYFFCFLVWFWVCLYTMTTIIWGFYCCCWCHYKLLFIIIHILVEWYTTQLVKFLTQFTEMNKIQKKI